MAGSLSLNGTWQLWHCKNGQGDIGELHGIPWLNGAVPGCAHYDLLQQGRIDDPFFEKNTRKLYELETHEWWYRTEFEVPKGFTGERIELIFEGLDTFATVWVNSTQVGTHANMFTPACFDVTGLVVPGQTNTVTVRLASPLASVEDLPLDGATATMNTDERLWARKLDQCYGWDIAPRIVTAGIWRPVRLVANDKARIGDDFLRVTGIRSLPASPDTPSRLSIVHEVPVETFGAPTGDLVVRVEGSCEDSRFEAEAPVKDGVARLEFEVPDALLWWTWDLGTPNLYEITISVHDAEDVIATAKRKQGLRTVRLVEDDDGDGRVSYVFELNGVKVFARGMNWTPGDCYHALAEGDKHRKLLDMSRRMNLNMLRVWGGGVYEPLAWFEQLDELGILVYQDFMMSCAKYPLHQGFLAIMAQEAEVVIKQLRNFACLALWSGDNENDVGYWGWWGGKIDVRENKITREVLPAAVEQFDGTRDYVPSSPYSPDPDVDPQDQHQGDTHCWHHGTPFEAPVYTRDESRFISEIGHLSCPSLETVRSFLSPHSTWPNENTVWDHHIGCHEDLDFNPPRRKAMDDSIIAYFGEKPDDLETYILASQICQGEAYKLWTECCRQRKAGWDCAGILLWNVADCWPQFSDAVIDYFLRPKLACNYVRWACQPVHVSFLQHTDGTVEVHVSNDTLAEIDATYRVELQNVSADAASTVEGRARIAANASESVLDVTELAQVARVEKGQLIVSLHSQGKPVSWNRLRLDKPTLAQIPEIIAGLPTF